MRTAMVVLFYVLTSLPCNAQKTHWCVSGGGIMAFVSGHDNTATYSPAFGLGAELIYIAPISERVSANVGVSYLQKGFVQRHGWGHDSLSVTYNERTIYNMISLPLRVSVRLCQNKDYSYWIEGGMNYNFMVHAATDVHFKTFVDGQQIKDQRATRTYATSLLPTSGSLVQTGSAQLYLFNPAVSLAVKLCKGKRFSLRLFYEYNLYDATIYRAPGNYLHLNTAGLLLDFQL